MVKSIGWLAVLYESQGRYAEAEPLYKRAPAPSLCDAAGHILCT